MLPAVLWLLNALSLVVVADAVLSWFAPNPRQLPRSLTFAVAEPLCAPFRRLLNPLRTGGIDVSPLLVLVVLGLIRRALVHATAGPW